MGINWFEVWSEHRDLFLACNWEQCSEEKRKAWRLPSKFEYFTGGEMSLRVGIVACSQQPKEEEFLLAGILLGKRISNGAKTVIYFIAPDFSPFFIHALGKIQGYLSLKAMYYREKLTPSLYPIPERNRYPLATRAPMKYSLGTLRPTREFWSQGLNPVARQQLQIIEEYFTALSPDIIIERKTQNILIKWSDYEIAEIKKRGRKLDLITKTKWVKDPELRKNWQKSGWVDSSDRLNEEFIRTIEEMIAYLECKESNREFSEGELLQIWLNRSAGIVSTMWGNRWHWPWLPKDRMETWVVELEKWYYYQADEALSVVCPITERTLSEVVNCLILSSVLELSNLVQESALNWDGRVHLLIFEHMQEELLAIYDLVKEPEQYPVWVLPQGWIDQGLKELNCKTSVPNLE